MFSNICSVWKKLNLQKQMCRRDLSNDITESAHLNVSLCFLAVKLARLLFNSGSIHACLIYHSKYMNSSGSIFTQWSPDCFHLLSRCVIPAFGCYMWIDSTISLHLTPDFAVTFNSNFKVIVLIGALFSNISVNKFLYFCLYVV